MLELPNTAVERLLATLARHCTAGVQGDVENVCLDMDGTVWAATRDDPEHAPDWREFSGMHWELAAFDPDPATFVATVTLRPARWELVDAVS